jgi:translation initiation factor 2 subunit 2
MPNDQEYEKMLDRAFEKMPKLAADISDFKIPAADTLMQGNKTVVRNIAQIAEKARRKPEEIARYLSKELAVPANAEGQTLMISGKFRQEDISARIKKYFETYVICKECKKPDSHLEQSGRGMVMFVCEACGSRYGIKRY